MRTLEEILKFDSGLTIGSHPVLFKRGDDVRAAIVRIPNRGFPRVTIKIARHLSTFQIRGNNFKPVGGINISTRDVSEFDLETRHPEKEIEVPPLRESNPIRRMYLWKYSPGSGLWSVQRDVTPETAERWLSIYRADEPKGVFVVSARKPTYHGEKPVFVVRLIDSVKTYCYLSRSLRVVRELGPTEKFESESKAMAAVSKWLRKSDNGRGYQIEIVKAR